MKITTPILITGAAAVAAVAFLSQGAGSDFAGATALVASGDSESRQSSGGGYAIYGTTTWTRSIWTNPFMFTVEVDTSEEDPVGLTFFSSSQVYSTSYEPDIVAGRSSEDFIVSGRAKGGDVVLERWVLQPTKGAYFTFITENPSPVPPIGTPTPILTPETYIFGGPNWLEPSLRSTVAAPRRIEIYRGAGIGSIDSMIFDGEGRYIALLSMVDKAIYRIDARSATAAPVMIADTTNIALLAGEAHLEGRKTNSGKRALVIWGDAYPGAVAIMWDDDNDGNFDRIDEMTVPAFEAAYPDGLAPF